VLVSGHGNQRTYELRLKQGIDQPADQYRRLTVCT
jgi:hypothetical protein